ncbi:MAG: D-glycerate dehydrogenase [Chloroflexi bacterium]|nr:D-glycerate dehydrogenase [Chloroflexota bacterium]
MFVTRILPGEPSLARLAARCHVDVWPDADPPPGAVLRDHAAGSSALLTMINDVVGASLLDVAPRLKVVAQMAVGYDNIDVDACSDRGVLVTNTPGVLTDTTADMTFALLMSAARRLPRVERAVRDGEWGEWNPTWMLGHQVTGATLGIVGPGRIGRAVAERARGFAMTVIYAGHRPNADFPGEYVTFQELLARSDFVSIHAPLTAETQHLFDDAAFAAMQPHAILVNTARGGLVDQYALCRALKTGAIGGAALDVTTPEPLPPDDPLLSAPNLTIAPHLGSATLQTRIEMAELAVDGVLAVLDGIRPQHLVNAEAWERRRP